MKSSLPADRHDENVTQWEAPVVTGESMRDSPDLISGQAIPTFVAG